MLTYVFLGMAFFAGFLIVFAINLVLSDMLEARRQAARERLAEEFRLRQKAKAKGSMEFKDLYELAAEGYVDLSQRVTLKQRLNNLIEQSGLRIEGGQLVALSILGAVLGTTAIGVLTWSPLYALLAGCVGASLPLLYVAWARQQRVEKLMSQLPDAFDLMSRVLRAGQTISQALQSVGDEFSRPIAEEFSYCYEQQNLGLSPEAAMRDLARRTGLLELKIFVLAVMIHRQTGGNLSDLLEKLAIVIRDRYRIRGQIKALTAEGQLQGLILVALPPLMLVILLMINRGYVMTLFDHPWLLVGTAASELLGWLWIRKIVNFDF